LSRRCRFTTHCYRACPAGRDMIFPPQFSRRRARVWGGSRLGLFDMQAMRRRGVWRERRRRWRRNEPKRSQSKPPKNRIGRRKTGKCAEMCCRAGDETNPLWRVMTFEPSSTKLSRPIAGRCPRLRKA
jgi:hypothetical protein